MEALLRLTVVPNTGTTAQHLTDYADHLPVPVRGRGGERRGRADDPQRRPRHDVGHPGHRDAARHEAGLPAHLERHAHAFNCSDEVAFTSLDVAQQYLDDSPYPQLVVFPMVVNEEFIAACLSYPTTLDRSVTEPVVSDIPTLIYLGQLDTQTPVSWGRAVAKGLSNSLVVEWNNMGHIAVSARRASTARATSPQPSWTIPSASRT